MAALFAVDPRGLTAARWCQAMTLALNPIGQLPAVRKDDDWRRWAHAVALNPLITPYGPPPPDNYQDWKLWAIDFVRTLNTGY